MDRMQLPPLCTELPYLADSSSYFEQIKQQPWPIFLDSANCVHDNARYDIQAASPFITLSTLDNNTLISYASGKTELSNQDPFLILQQLLARYATENNTDLPFCGGALGYFAYDLGRRLEDLPKIAQDAEHIPAMVIGLYDWAIVTDHARQKCWLASYAMDETTKSIFKKLSEDLLINVNSENKVSNAFTVTSAIRTNLNRKQYQQAFNSIKDYITEGDCYQINLTKRFEVDAEGDPWQAYSVLRQQNPAPFSTYFDTPYVTILSSSPERLLRCNNNNIETKPIKGTRPRDLDNQRNDQRLATELQQSIKDRAENVMIVDLLRNDLGKVCKTGSIKVPEPFKLESFATVHHLVSTITGELAEQQNAVSLLRACFPGGSITGAPKVRAMEIIEELEPHQRGIYCGSIAYIDFSGRMDSNIAIRTLIYNNNRLRFWAGGGIVFDSDADEEYQEIEDKAAAMIRLVKQFSAS